MTRMNTLYKHLCIVIANSMPNEAYFNRIKVRFYRAAGLKIGKNTTVVGPLSLPTRCGERIFIDENSYLNSETRFGPNGSEIRIGRNCLIGPRVSFETGSHTIELDHENRRSHFTEKIVVEHNVWIGAGAIILHGVAIGEGAVVAAGAVVNRDVERYTVVGGIPAKFIKNVKSLEYEPES